MISHGLKKEHRSLKERGLHEDSHFTTHFHDGSSVCETEMNWSDMSETIVCDYFGGKKTVAVCKHPVKTFHVKHGDLEHTVEVPEGFQVYQAIRSETTFSQTGHRQDRILGRVVGLVKDGKVTEEYFLNGIEGEIFGARS